MRDKLPWWRRLALSAVLLALGAVFLDVVDEHYAIGDWLVWHYLQYWVWCIVIGLGSLGTGEQIILRLTGRIRGLYAHLLVSFCTGLLVFGLLVFGAGLLQLYQEWLFYALPLALLLMGLPRLLVMRRELVPRLRRLSPLDVRGLGAIAILVFGMYAWLLIYAFVLTPNNVMFDSQWKHLAIAESFAAHGGVFRFEQGWMFASRPHFASYLYTWAYLVPGREPFDQITLCGHLEFMIFAVTTFLGVPAMVRRIVPDADPKLVWVARFLFPGVFLYDSNLSIGADHIAAVFAVPIFIATEDLVRGGFRVRNAVLVGVMTAGILLTKETAASITIPSATLALVVGAGWHLWRSRRSGAPLGTQLRFLPAAAAIAVTGLVVSSPLWLKNILWYGDPFYPNFYQYFSPRPWSEDSAYLLEWGFYDYQFGLWVDPDQNKLVETLKVLFTWSFVPHDWTTFHGKRPVIGSLLTMLLPCLLLLRGNRRLWVVAVWIHVGIAAWFRVLPQDRYLQVLMPWMAAWTAAVLVLAWRSRVRVAVGALVVAQVVWGGDAYFLHRNRLPDLVELFSASHPKRQREDEDVLEKRFKTQGSWYDVGKHLPEGARLVVHEVHPHLGTNVPTYDDFQTYQFGLPYGLMRSPRELWDTYRSMGITHLHWAHHKSRSWDSVAGDIMFFDMALRLSVDRKRFANSWVAALPAEPPEDEAGFEDTVVVLNCMRRGLRPGLYRVRDLHVPSFGPQAEQLPEPRRLAKSQAEALVLAESASYAVVDPSCRSAVSKLPKGFRLAARRKLVTRLKNRPYEIFIRLTGHASPWPQGELPTAAPDRPTRDATPEPEDDDERDDERDPDDERAEASADDDAAGGDEP